MTALESIVAWAESELLAWQGDAVRRLLTQDTLTEADRQELLLMFKALHGLLPDEITPPEPQALEMGMVSGAPKSKAQVVLKSMKDLRSVNAIPDGSSLGFGHRGLTAIYGENGTGKSGYARVLKRACRARDTSERIEPNIFRNEPPLPAKATFKLSVGAGPDKDVQWEDGEASDKVLTNVTVFDARCARVIVDDANEVTYLPYGAHVFEELVHLQDWMKQRIEAERPEPKQVEQSEIAPATRPGAFLSGITHKTSDKDVESLASWSNSDTERLEELTKRVAALESSDPVKQAAALRSLKERVVQLAACISQGAAKLSDASLTELEELLAKVERTQKAVEVASQVALQDEPLPGAGEQVWQALFAAARDYSEEAAYSNAEYPFVGDGSRCVYCMQPLSEDAKQRLLRFDDFMEQAVTKAHDAAKTSLGVATQSAEQLRASVGAKQLAVTIGEVKLREEPAAVAAERYLAALGARLEYADRLVTKGTPGELPFLPGNPAGSLTKLANALEQEADRLEEADDPAARKNVKAELAELVARKCFTDNQTQILAYLADLKAVQRCNQATASIDTASITRKGRSIVSEALTPQLRTAIVDELEQLGANHLPLNLKPIGSKGETLHQFELKGVAAGRKINLTDVLSEGEQRVVALAGFFAEIGSGQHSCPIVLDDPVSSLDHRYRAKIAARLVLESKERQVLVFTHDIAFLLDLQSKASELENIYFTSQTVRREDGEAGVPTDGLPWHAMSVKGRLQCLRRMHRDIKDLHSTEQTRYDKEAASLYALLRETWEAAVEETLLNSAIKRHGSEVQTRRLKGVSVTTEQYKAIDVNMSKCSTWMLGHDKSKSLDAHRPVPKEALGDIEILAAFVSECKKARAEIEKERDSALKPNVSEIG